MTLIYIIGSIILLFTIAQLVCLYSPFKASNIKKNFASKGNKCTKYFLGKRLFLKFNSIHADLTFFKIDTWSVYSITICNISIIYI